LEWSYNPFIPLRLRYIDGVVSEAKAGEIVASASTLNVFISTAPSTNMSATKSLPQTLSRTSYTVRDWDEQTTSSAFDWVESTGVLVFTIPTAFIYDITFTTQVSLPHGSDKYIGEIWIEDYYDTGTDWEEVEDTRRKFLITNSTQTIHYTKQYSGGDRVRVRTQLIPNPDERRMLEIPDYATLILNKGKWVWRDILPQGYIDPITNNGVDYPFFNKRRYLFEPIVFDVIPNLDLDEEFEHENTQTVFNEIEFSPYAGQIDETPVTDLDDIEKPCQ